MSEERLQEIKDCIDLQYKVLEIAKAENAKVFVDEEKELYDEVLRLNNIINELEKFTNARIQKCYDEGCYIEEFNVYNEYDSKIKELKGSDKE